MLLRGPSLSLFVYLSSLEFAWKHSEFFLLVFRIFVSLSYCQTETQFTVQMIDFQIHTYMVNDSKTSLLTLFVAMIDTLNLKNSTPMSSKFWPLKEYELGYICNSYAVFCWKVFLVRHYKFVSSLYMVQKGLNYENNFINLPDQIWIPPICIFGAEAAADIWNIKTEKYKGSWLWFLWHRVV